MMDKKRTLLFYIHDQKYYYFKKVSDMKISMPLKEALQAALVGINFNFSDPNQPLKKVSGNPSDYVSYAWDNEKLSDDIPVCQIPSPGIVMSIRNGSMEPKIGSIAFKLQITSSKDSQVKESLNNFYSGPESKFKPNTSSTDIIDIKPNFFGIGLNLNEAWNRIKKWVSTGKNC